MHQFQFSAPPQTQCASTDLLAGFVFGKERESRKGGNDKGKEEGAGKGGGVDGESRSSSRRFNVPPNTLQVILGTISTGQMTQPTVSSTEGQ